MAEIAENGIFLYYNSKGVLCEQYLDVPVRQGSLNFNHIYVHIAKSDPDTTINPAIVGLSVAFGIIPFSDITWEYDEDNPTNDPNEYIIAPEIILSRTSEDVYKLPYNKDRDLKFFRYNTNYEFFDIVLPPEVLERSGTVRLTIKAIFQKDESVPVDMNDDGIISFYEAQDIDRAEVMALGLFVFNIESETILPVEERTTLAQWNYLLFKIAQIQGAIGGVIDDVPTSGSSNLITSGGVYSWTDENFLRKSNTDAFISSLMNDDSSGVHSALVGIAITPETLSDVLRGSESPAAVIIGDPIETIDGNVRRVVRIVKYSDNYEYHFVEEYDATTDVLLAAYTNVGSLPGSSTTGYKLSPDGLLTASNAVIYGTVYATAGEFSGKITSYTGDIGGWKITPLALYSSKSYRVTAELTDPDTVRFSWDSETDGDYTVTYYYKTDGDWQSATLSVLQSNANHYVDITIQGLTAVSFSETEEQLFTDIPARSLYVGLSSNGNLSTAIWAGAENSATAPFRVDRDGTLHATGAKITGEITATRLTLEPGVTIPVSQIDGVIDQSTVNSAIQDAIENLNITDIAESAVVDAITISTETTDDGVTVQTVNVGTGQDAKSFTYITSGDFVLTNIGIGTGTQNPESPTQNNDKYFKVDTEGLLTANNAIIRGKIIATSGAIAGWTIDSNKLSYGTLATDGSVYLYPQGNGSSASRNNIALSIGSSFWVDKNGKLYATGADLTGYATQSYVTSRGYQTASDVENTLNQAEMELQYWIQSQGYTTPDELNYAISSFGFSQVNVSTGTTANGITTKTVTVQTSGATTTYNVQTSENFMIFGQAKGTVAEGETGFIVSTDGLLTAHNAVIYGTVYATDGRFAGEIHAQSGYIGRSGALSISDNGILGTGYALIDSALHLGDDENYTALYSSGGMAYIQTHGVSNLRIQGGNSYIELNNDSSGTEAYTFTIQAQRFYSPAGQYGAYDFYYNYRVVMDHSRPVPTTITAYFWIADNSGLIDGYPTMSHTFTIPANSTISEVFRDDRLDEAYGWFAKTFIIAGFSRVSLYYAVEPDAPFGPPVYNGIYRLDAESVFPLNQWVSLTAGNNPDIHHTLTQYLTNTLGNATIYCSTNFLPKNNSNLGNPQYPWNNLFLSGDIINTTVISPSDRNQKNSIAPLAPEYSLLFDLLQPVSFKFNNNTSDRTHTGFIAQEVKDALEQVGLTTKDFAAYCEWEGGGCGLRYSEFISLCVNEIQKLKTRVKELENKGENKQ